MSSHRILLLVDFSEGSDAALAVAKSIAAEKGSQVHLLHAHGPRGIVSETLFAEHERAAAARLGEIGDALARDGVEATALVHPGSPLDAFESVEDEIRPDLVVVGARGATRLRRLLVGSVARGVVEHAFSPVLVVRGEPVAFPFRRILVASDFSPDSEAAAESARAVGTPDAEIHLAHVNPVPYEKIAELGSAAIEKLRSESQERLDEAADAIGATAHISSGAPAREIVRLGEKLACDLIAVGTQGAGATTLFEGGSVALSVLRRAPVSVLVARRRATTEAVATLIDDLRIEAGRTGYEAEDERPRLGSTLRFVALLADEGRELESDMFREVVEELEELAQQAETAYPNLAATLSALIRTLSRMGI